MVGEADFFKALPERLNLDRLSMTVDPRAEWTQIFNEAWRINRDFFYAPNMHGVNWTAARPMPRVTK